MEKIWLKSYPKGISATISIDSNDSLVKLFETACKTYPEKPAFVNFGKTLTFREVDELSRDLAAYLQHTCKLEKGDSVALMMPNILQYPIALFAILRAGLVAVNVNPMYTARELQHQLSDAGSKAIILWESAGATLESVIAKTKIQHVITTKIGDMLKFPKGLIFDFVLKYVKRQVKPFHLPSAVNFKKALREGSFIDLHRHEIKADDIAFLQYTGGTTGISKGAMLTHSNILANVAQAKEWLSSHYREGEDDIVITALPMYHIFSLTANLMVFFQYGSLSVL